MARISIAEVNALSDGDFVERFGGVLEDSPQLAAAIAARRPYAGAEALADAFVAAAHGLGPEGELALVRAHPELGALRPMAVASAREQASAGLPAAAAHLQSRLADGNAAYRDRFGFPFVVAVRGRTPEQIVGLLEARLGNGRDAELATALEQVALIARLRVDQLVDGS